jgi:hypothetical protein
MAHVPYDAVFGGVIDIVKGNGNLGNTETRRQMTGIDRYLLDNVLSQFIAHLGELVYLQFA